jgi:hypothetical protein
MIRPEDQPFREELLRMSDSDFLEAWRKESLAGGPRKLSVNGMGDSSRTFRLAVAEGVAVERFGEADWLMRYRTRFPGQMEYGPG